MKFLIASLLAVVACLADGCARAAAVCDPLKCDPAIFKECPDRYQVTAKGECCAECTGLSLRNFPRFSSDTRAETLTLNVLYSAELRRVRRPAVHQPVPGVLAR